MRVIIRLLGLLKLTLADKARLIRLFVQLGGVAAWVFGMWQLHLIGLQDGLVLAVLMLVPLAILFYKLAKKN